MAKSASSSSKPPTGILPEVGPHLGAYAARALAARGIDLRLDTRLESCVDGEIVPSDGERFHAETLVWRLTTSPRSGCPGSSRSSWDD